MGLTREQREHVRRERDRIIRARVRFEEHRLGGGLAPKCLQAADGDAWTALDLAVEQTRRGMRDSEVMGASA